MATSAYRVLLAFPLILSILGKGWAQGKVIDDGPQKLSQISSIGESLRNAGQRPVHILYVHGIGAIGAGGSEVFRKGICAFVKDCRAAGAPLREYADSGEFESDAEPPTLEYMGKPVWATKQDWRASSPFVDHYVILRGDGGPIVVDEINWWPLVFPLKCRAIMTGEARLAGPDKTFLKLCSKAEEKDASHSGRFITYTWINSSDVKTLESIRPKGALLNRDLKNSILDWGFSDAIMAVGSMQGLFREGIRQLFVKSARFNADGSKTNQWEQQFNNPNEIDREFIVVSHSLGAYLVFSTLNMGQPEVLPETRPTELKSDAATEDAASQYILERTSLVYFFANQVPLLELASMRDPKTATSLRVDGLPQGDASEAFSKRIIKWRELRENFRKERGDTQDFAAKPPQVVAWSDPSDLLSWYVPGIDDLIIDNLYVRNTWWHWLIANPGSAHGNYASNKKVLRMMMVPKAPSATSQVGK
jgi:hypothetical protein